MNHKKNEVNTNSSNRINETNQNNSQNTNGSNEFYESSVSNEQESNDSIRIVLSDETIQTSNVESTTNSSTTKKTRKKRNVTILNNTTTTNDGSTLNIRIDEEKVLYNPNKSYESVKLYPHQIEHTEKLLGILSKNYYALDLSPMGTGKTYCATHIAREMSFKRVVVIAPLSVLPKWKYMCDSYGLKLSYALSYCSLRSVKCKQPKHGLLTRVDRRSEVTDEDTGQTNTMDIVEFFATDVWKRYVSEGVLLIVDEIQNVKNISSQYYSVKELIREIREETPNNSKVLLLSGTPIDKIEQVKNLYRAIGLLTRSIQHYDRSINRTIATGYRELIANHQRMLSSGERIQQIFKKMNDLETFRQDMERYNTRLHRYVNCAVNGRIPHPGAPPIAPPQLTREEQEIYSSQIPYIIHQCMTYAQNIEQRGSSGSRNLRYIDRPIYDLFCQIFCKYVSSAMKRPEQMNHIHKRNAYYYVPHEQRELLQKGVHVLQQATNFSEDTGQVHFQEGNRMATFQGITRGLQMIETSKIPIFVREARELLELNPHYKVVICVNYVDTIKDIQQELSSYNPLLLYGSTNELQRGRVVSQFEESNTRYRVLIGNIECLSTGIDLDDKDGAFPRFVLVSPNYRIITLEQLTYRFLRMDTKSDTDLHFVFGRVMLRNGEPARGYEELPIINALAKKSNVMRDVTNASMSTDEEEQQQVDQVYQYPGSYETWIDSKLM
jgi:superfamily II DNA or RNA helicase